MCCDCSTLPTMLLIPHSFLGFIKQQCLFCPPSWGPEVSVSTHLSCTYYINCFTDLVNCLGCWCWNTKAAEWLRVWRINQKWYSEWPTLLLSSTWYLTHPHPLLTPHPHPSSRLWSFSLFGATHLLPLQIPSVSICLMKTRHFSTQVFPGASLHWVKSQTQDPTNMIALATAAETIGNTVS